MAIELVTALLISMVPSVALFVAGWILYKFRNWLVATIVFVVGLVVAAYAALRLLVHSQDLQLSLKQGELPLLVIWSVVHFVIICVLALKLVYNTIAH